MRLPFRKRSKSARPLLLIKGCGHARHIGSCPFCQRAQQEKWAKQLKDADQ